ncbi:MAG: hypothetical protein V4555_09220 [Acidobacteriota bacterium]
MGEFLKKASDLFWRKPVLWLPVIIADLLGTAINQGQGAIVRAMVMRRTEVHSALGGAVQHVRLTPEIAAQAVQAATPMVWVSYFLRISLYVIALVVTVAMVQQLLDRMQASPTPQEVLRTRKAGMLSLAVRILALDAVGSVAIEWTGRWLLMHGHKTVATSPWYHLGTSATLTVLLALFAGAAALRMLVGAPVSDEGANRAVVMPAMLGVGSLALGFLIGSSIPMGHTPSPAAQIALGTTASLITAVPFILMFIAFGVLANEERNAVPNVDAEA